MDITASALAGQLLIGLINGSTSTDRTNYWEVVPTGSLELALWMESDRMGYLLPALTEDKFTNQRDVVLNESARSVRLERALVLDLGAVAKGLAIDMAVQELRPLANFVVDAGGDVYCGGHNATEQPWTVGIRHPRESNALLTRVTITDAALCTSGDYERRVADDTAGEHHMLDPNTGASPRDVISASVIAPTAMVADALGTAAFVLGCIDGVALLERHALRACLVDAQLVRHTTPDWIDV